LKFKRNIYLEVSRKLQNSVSVKVFALRAAAAPSAERVCLGTLHMHEEFFVSLRRVLELGLRAAGGSLALGGSYFGREAPAMVAAGRGEPPHSERDRIHR
jgi:hypothetical protein